MSQVAPWRARSTGCTQLLGPKLGVINVVPHWVMESHPPATLAASSPLHMEAMSNVLLNWTVLNKSELCLLIFIPLKTPLTSGMLPVQVCVNSSLLSTADVLIQVFPHQLSQNIFLLCCSVIYFENKQTEKKVEIKYSLFSHQETPENFVTFRWIFFSVIRKIHWFTKYSS